MSRVLLMAMTLTVVASSVVFVNAQAPKVGVMVLAHGGTDEWNQLVENATKPVEAKYPTEIAFGMALPRTMQAAIDKLENQGVEKIVVIPLFISSHSFIIRQSEYLLGKRDALADPPLVMDHSGGGDHGATNSHGGGQNSMHGNAHGQHGGHISHDGHGSKGESNSLARLKLKADVIFTRPLDDHPLVASIIHDRIAELSKKSSDELIILVGHGPNPEEDNKNWVRDMESVADQVRVLQKMAGKVSKMILAVTVRDDADKDIYNQAKENLRNLVIQGGKQGDVIVIPLFLSSGGAERNVVTRLEGLQYRWNGKTLLPDPKISEFMMLSIATALK